MKRSLWISAALLAGCVTLIFSFPQPLEAQAAGGDHTLHFEVPPTPPCGSTFFLQVGQLITFPVQLTPDNPADTAGLRPIGDGLPGATLTPPAPLLGNPVLTTFAWTPEEAGTYGATFAGVLVGYPARAYCGFTFEVLLPAEAQCSYTQGGWGATPQGHNPAKTLANHFAAVYPSGIEVGIPGAGGFSMLFTSAVAVKNYLPAGGAPGALLADQADPAANNASGVFGGQVLALQINVDFSAAGVLKNKGSAYGDVRLCGTGNLLVDGLTVSDVLNAANEALGGGDLPFGMSSISELNDLVTSLNEAFDNCQASSWGSVHLCQ